MAGACTLAPWQPTVEVGDPAGGDLEDSPLNAFQLSRLLSGVVAPQRDDHRLAAKRRSRKKGEEGEEGRESVRMRLLERNHACRRKE